MIDEVIANFQIRIEGNVIIVLNFYTVVYNITINIVMDQSGKLRLMEAQYNLEAILTVQNISCDVSTSRGRYTKITIHENFTI